MINETNMRLWVKALRSGDFEQGIGVLRKGDKYCCLGVACEVAIQAGLPVEVKVSVACGVAGCGCAEVTCYDGAQSALPASVMEWLGLDWENPSVPVPAILRPSSRVGAERTLSACNDSLRLPFHVIANLIEAAYLNNEPKGSTGDTEPGTDQAVG